MICPFRQHFDARRRGECRRALADDKSTARRRGESKLRFADREYCSILFMLWSERRNSAWMRRALFKQCRFINRMKHAAMMIFDAMAMRYESRYDWDDKCPQKCFLLSTLPITRNALSRLYRNQLVSAKRFLSVSRHDAHELKTSRQVYESAVIDV